MKNEKVVSINGQKYNQSTGLPLTKSDLYSKQSTNSPSVIRSVHSISQRSQAIYNRATKKIGNDIKVPLGKMTRNMDVVRNKNISHFAPRPIQKSTKPIVNKKQLMDLGPIKHPIIAKIEKQHASAQKKTTIHDSAKSPKQIKEEVITQALNSTSKIQQKNTKKRWYNNKFINIFSLSLILMVAVGYFTYLNVPIISVKIASAQAGINATYPDYCPDGYSLNGPVQYADGEVSINFNANTGNNKFVIKQSRSLWDSSAVKNKVNEDSNGEFITTEENGLTIYTYGDNAIWVNGGILYSISGDTRLSNDQIRKIAISL